MHIGEALLILDACRHWSVSRHAASCSWEVRRPASPRDQAAWQPRAASAVRRLKGETLEAMLVRLAALAASRQASGWPTPAFCGAGLRCAGCGAANRFNGLRLERRSGLALCPACRQGLAAPALSKP